MKLKIGLAVGNALGLIGLGVLSLLDYLDERRERQEAEERHGLFPDSPFKEQTVEGTRRDTPVDRWP